jgi:signal peptidase I
MTHTVTANPDTSPVTVAPVTAASVTATSPDVTLDNDAVETKPHDTPAKIDWWGEVKGIFWLLLAVLGFHSFIAKPFYIPSESMMPNLLVGDRLVVNKMSYGWSHVSPTIPSLPALFNWLILRQPVDSLAVKLPEWKGRLWGGKPERGDVVILTPPGKNQDYIKRVIGLPGDRIEVRDGTVILNGTPVTRAKPVQRLIPVDENTPCNNSDYPGGRVAKTDGSLWCRLTIVRETLPNGLSYDTIDMETQSYGDNYAALEIPDGHFFLMGDNRDHSADSRFSLASNGLGGPVRWENIGGRAMFITFSLDGTTQWWNPLTWFAALRSGRAGTSLAPDKAAAASPEKR